MPRYFTQTDFVDKPYHRRVAAGGQIGPNQSWAWDSGRLLGQILDNPDPLLSYLFLSVRKRVHLAWAGLTTPENGLKWGFCNLFIERILECRFSATCPARVFGDFIF
jgi:hypothetical protein